MGDGLSEIVVSEFGVGQVRVTHMTTRQRDDKQTGIRRPLGRTTSEVTHQPVVLLFTRPTRVEGPWLRVTGGRRPPCSFQQQAEYTVVDAGRWIELVWAEPFCEQGMQALGRSLVILHMFCNRPAYARIPCCPSIAGNGSETSTTDAQRAFAELARRVEELKFSKKILKAAGIAQERVTTRRQ